MLTSASMAATLAGVVRHSSRVEMRRGQAIEPKLHQKSVGNTQRLRVPQAGATEAVRDVVEH